MFYQDCIGHFLCSDTGAVLLSAGHMCFSSCKMHCGMRRGVVAGSGLPCSEVIEVCVCTVYTCACVVHVEVLVNTHFGPQGWCWHAAAHIWILCSVCHRTCACCRCCCHCLGSRTNRLFQSTGTTPAPGRPLLGSICLCRALGPALSLLSSLPFLWPAARLQWPAKLCRVLALTLYRCGLQDGSARSDCRSASAHCR